MRCTLVVCQESNCSSRISQLLTSTNIYTIITTIFPFHPSTLDFTLCSCKVHKAYNLIYTTYNVISIQSLSPSSKAVNLHTRWHVLKEEQTFNHYQAIILVDSPSALHFLLTSLKNLKFSLVASFWILKESISRYLYTYNSNSRISSLKKPTLVV